MTAKEKALEILNSNNLCALSTYFSENQQPCVAFVNYFNLDFDLFVIMDKNSLKFKNLKSHKKVAFAINSNQGTLQAFANAEEIDKTEFLDKHPRLQNPDMSLVKLVPFDMKVSIEYGKVEQVEL